MIRRSLFWLSCNRQGLALLRSSFTLSRVNIIHSSKDLFHPLQRNSFGLGENEVNRQLEVQN